MRDLVEFLRQKKHLFKSLREISPKTLGSRKRLKLYIGVDLSDYYVLVMQIEKKSRMLQKEVEELSVLHQKLEASIGSKINKKYLWIKAPLCSKAKALLKEHGWRVWHEDLS